jgi:hypothetical protein
MRMNQVFMMPSPLLNLISEYGDGMSLPGGERVFSVYLRNSLSFGC